MINGINCPYCQKVSANKIDCKRGEVPTDYSSGSILRQKDKFCNGTYRKCWCYKYLEGAWGHEKVRVCAESR